VSLVKRTYVGQNRFPIAELKSNVKLFDSDEGLSGKRLQFRRRIQGNEVLGDVVSALRGARMSRYNVDPQAIRLALRDQHQKILDLLLSGQLF
jgi:DNA-binding FadR family transcriptional regulator